MSITAESVRVFKRVIELSGESMTPERATCLSKLDFPPRDHARYQPSLSRRQPAH